MTTPRVVEENEVSLNGVFYPIKGPVQSTLASIYPSKVVIGDTTRDSQLRASVLSWSDWRGGIGVERMAGATQADRAWWSTLHLRNQGHLVLPRYTKDTKAISGIGIVDVTVIGELSNAIYAAFGLSVRSYDNVADDWGSELDALPAAASDIITARVGGTVFLVIACGTHYVRTVDGATWEEENDDIEYLSYWDDRLWGIDSTGQLKWANNLALGGSAPTWTDDAQLQLPNDYVTDLFVSRDAGGEPILYVSTKVGLFAHDAANSRFVETELTLPFHPNTGQGTTKWRDNLYIPAAEGVLSYTAGATAVVTTIGPDQDDGVFNEDGIAFSPAVIRQLIPSHNDLIALWDATKLSDEPLDMYTGTDENSESSVFQTGLGRSAVMAWNRIGWQVLWANTAVTDNADLRSITYGLVSNAYSTYRLWWGQSGRVYYQDLPQSFVNPKQVTTFQFDGTGELITPWFNADQVEVSKLALELKVEVADASATETVVVEYATNYDTDKDNYTTLGTINSNGTTTYQFPSASAPAGTEFRSIRFRITLARGTTRTVSPDVVNMTFIYRKKLPAKWGHTFTTDIFRPYKGKSEKELRSALISAIESDPLVEFTFRDDDGGTRNFYVDALQATGIELTGHNEGGETRVTVVEP